jgi:predicted dehydrogenase
MTPTIIIVGCRFGASIVAQLTRPGATGPQVIGVCDLDPQMAQQVAERHGVPVVSGFDAALADPACTAIGLFTPPAGRAALLRRCIAARKDVMTTKPLEVDAEAAQAVLEEARAAGIVIHLNSPNPGLGRDLRAMRELQRTQDLGRLVQIQGEVHASYHEERDGGWYDDPVRCPVAPLFRIGIYLLNDILALMASAPTAVQVLTGRVRTGRPTPDQGMALLGFPGGRLAHLSASFCIDDGRPWRNSLTVGFERGTITRNVALAGPSRGAHVVMSRTMRALPNGTDRQVVEQCIDEPWSGHYDWSAFVAAIATRQTLDVESAAVAVNSIRTIEALARAEAKGAG